jgi:hypothetical protein
VSRAHLINDLETGDLCRTYGARGLKSAVFPALARAGFTCDAPMALTRRKNHMGGKLGHGGVANSMGSTSKCPSIHEMTSSE